MPAGGAEGGELHRACDPVHGGQLSCAPVLTSTHQHVERCPLGPLPRLVRRLLMALSLRTLWLAPRCSDEYCMCLWIIGGAKTTPVESWRYVY